MYERLSRCTAGPQWHDCFSGDRMPQSACHKLLSKVLNMSTSTVEQILRQIDSLDEDSRRLLDERLTARAEAEWSREASEARQVARMRGIDQAAIDRAVETVRYQP